MNIQLRTGVAADATAIHALIAANLSVGHLLPRTFEDIESHADRFVVAVKDEHGHRLRRAGAAQRRGRRGPLARRRRGEPRPAHRRRARDGAGRSRARAGLRDAVRVHAPAVALRPPRVLDRAARVGARRRSRSTASAAASSATAASTPCRCRCAPAPGCASSSSAPPQRVGRAAAHQRRAPAAPPRRGMTDPAVKPGLVSRTIEGSVSAPAGFRAAGVACGIKKSDGARPRADRQRHAGVERRPCSRRTRRMAAPVLVSKARLAGVGRALARRRDQQRLRQRLHRPGRAWRPPRRWPTPPRARPASMPSQVLVASTGVIGVSLDRQRVTDGIAAAAKALARDGGAGGGARDHDDRSLSQGSGGRGRRRRRARSASAASPRAPG